MLRQLTTHCGRRWITHTLRAINGHLDLEIPTATTVDAATLAGLPGGIVEVPAPGHTSGHTAYLLASEGVLFSGDALVAGHPQVTCAGPQLLPSVFTHDQACARESALQLAALPASILVPGHGTPIVLYPGELTRALGQLCPAQPGPAAPATLRTASRSVPMIGSLNLLPMLTESSCRVSRLDPQGRGPICGLVMTLPTSYPATWRRFGRHRRSSHLWPAPTDH